jgi:hypothetical protein
VVVDGRGVCGSMLPRRRAPVVGSRSPTAVSRRRTRRVPAYARGRSWLRLRADPVAAGGGSDDPMGPVATRLRLPGQAQDTLLAVFVALFQLLGTYRATGNQPGSGRSATPTASATCCWPRAA